MDTDKLRILRALRLKGRVLPADLPAATGVTENQCDSLTTQLISSGLVEQARDRLKLTPQGRDLLTELLADEQATVDRDVITALYAEFDEFNVELKTLMTRWQLKDAETPNDHTDPDYDRSVVDGLNTLDAKFRDLLDRLVDAAPRIGHYPKRFTDALNRLNAGDHTWFAKPLADSYHTVWFELHEDLIGLAGLSRAEEAAAGRAE